MNLRPALFLVPASALLAACGGGEENEVNAANLEEPVINEFVPTNEVTDNMIDNNVVDNNAVDNNAAGNNTVNAY